jgi:hypothetical protein
VTLKLVPKRKKKKVRAAGGGQQCAGWAVAPPLSLDLRAPPRARAQTACPARPAQAVKWAEDVAEIDEFAGKKKSKSARGWGGS